MGFISRWSDWFASCRGRPDCWTDAWIAQVCSSRVGVFMCFIQLVQQHHITCQHVVKEATLSDWQAVILEYNNSVALASGEWLPGNAIYSTQSLPHTRPPGQATGPRSPHFLCRVSGVLKSAQMREGVQFIVDVCNGCINCVEIYVWIV